MKEIYIIKQENTLLITLNGCSFVNSSLRLILCGDGVYICKIKKIMVSRHAVADKLLDEWLPREI